jgi:Ca-activated chloride channel family protein
LRLVTGLGRGRRYADPGLLPWARAQAPRGLEPGKLWRPAMLALAWLLFAMAMAGPRLEQTRLHQDEGAYTELLVVLDLSHSMTARDVEPGRLERAKLELHDLVARSERLKIGLVVYAARPHLMNPPTADKTVLRRSLQHIHHGLLPTEGSNLRDAMVFAASHFTAPRSARAMLLVTDGELPTDDVAAEMELEDTASWLRQQGILLYALGIGTPEGTALMSRQGGWLRHEGKAAITRLHEDRLKKLAALGGGRYEPVSDTDAEWRRLLDQGIGRLEPVDEGGDGDRLVVWKELYGWCLAPALLFMLLAHAQPRRERFSAAPMLLATVFLYGLLDPGTLYAAGPSGLRDAAAHYQKEAYQEARQAYARIPGYAGRMGEGGSAYRMAEYPAAAQLFTLAVLDAESDIQRADALFNLANSQFRLEDYGTAAALYQEVLRYDASRQAARVNLELAEILRERREESDERSGAARPGQGPRTARLAEGTDLDGGSARLDDAEVERPPVVPDLIADRPLSASELIELGIHHSRSVAPDDDEFEAPDWDYAVTRVERILLQTDALEVDEAMLWKRMFETEEGFPAPVEDPLPVADMPPW